MAQLVRKLGGETLVNTHTQWLQTWPSLAAFADGGFVTVWNDGDGIDGNGWGVRAQLFDPAGAKVGDELAINQLVAGNQLEPTVAVLPDGNFAVAWAAPGDLVKARLFGPSGLPLGDEFEVNSGTTGEQSQPNLFALAGGGFAVAWWDHGKSLVADAHIRVQMFAADGTRGPELVMGSTGFVNYPEGVGLASGNFVILWQDQSQINGAYQLTIRAQMFDSAGAAVGGEFWVSPGFGGETFPEVAALSDGGFVAAWSGPSGHAWLQRFDSAGTKDGGLILAGQNVYEPKVTALSWGGFMLAWTDQTRSTPVLRGQLFDGDGNLLGAEFQINSAAAEAGGANLELTTLPGDVVVAAWRNEEGGAGERLGVKLQRLYTPAVGTSGDDVLAGGAGDESLAGLQGNDLVSGGGGDDVLDGGYGDDVLKGGAGVDTFDGGWGTDTIDFSGDPGPYGVVVNLGFGVWITPLDRPDLTRAVNPQESFDGSGTYESLAGIENAVGTDYVDVLNGNSYDNRLEGGGGDDRLYADWGTDRLLGGAGNDRLDAGTGNDFIDGGTGADWMFGEWGDDIFFVDDSGDTVEERSNEGVDEVRTGLATYILAANVENLTATSDVAHDFRGNAGNNVVTGAAGNDLMRFQDGGDDTAIGGAGNDAFLFIGSLTSADVLDGGAGSDELVLQGDYSAGLTLGAVTGVELIVLVPGSDTRFGAPGTQLYSYSITTTDQNVAAGVQMNVDGNRLRAGENLVFDGSAETDGSFYVFAGKGVDTLTGGARNDAFLFRGPGNFTGADTVNGGAGFDELALRGDYTGAYAVTFGATTISGIEAIVVVSGYDLRYGKLAGDLSFDLTLNEANVQPGQAMIVDAGTLRSTEKLTFDGSAETDGGRFTMFGGKGNDALTGGSGADSIRGGLGADALKGNAGADTFVYRDAAESTTGAVDHILDFLPGTDKIDLSRIDADTLTAGNQAFTWTESFSGTAGELMRDHQGGTDWLILGDTDGDRVADLVILVTAPPTVPIWSNDFIL